MTMKAGLRVVRGPDWKWDDVDGGEGQAGTVVDIGGGGQSTVPEKCVTVVWDCGASKNVRVGYQGAFDLVVLDSAQCGVRHPDTMCSECLYSGIVGMRWQCTECHGVSLCTQCYMSDKHDTAHGFRRFDTATSEGVEVPKRSESQSQKREASGIFVGATVVRGRDWSWGVQDGGDGKEGTVTDFSNGDDTHFKSMAKVTWSVGTSNVYRIGFKAKVDLKCVKAASGGNYYRNHLPVLGRDNVTEVTSPADVSSEVDVEDQREQLMRRLFMANPLLQMMGGGVTLQEPEVDPEEMLGLSVNDLSFGFRVVRGPGWKYDDLDGGEGHLGTVRRGKETLTLFELPKKTVQVLWDNGTKQECRVGEGGVFDLLVLDTAARGVKQNFECRECKSSKILGIRWMCTECCDFDLCTECYMADKHDLAHEFLRIDGPTLKRVLVPKRCDSQDNKVEVKGMFLGAKVVRGQDWKWGDQDGESGKQGQVVERRHYATDSYRSAVKVLWTVGSDSICRVGHNGKVDLKCVKPTSGGCYYKSHLQVLGQKTEPYFKKGDKVKCFRNLENLLRLQEKRFKWMDSAAKYLDRVGTVKSVSRSGDVTVVFNESDTQEFNPDTIIKLKFTSHEVKVQMDSPVVQEALKQNVPRLALEKVIEHNLAFGAGDFTTVEELRQAVENLKARTAKGTNGTAAASQAGADAEKGDAAGPEGQNLCKVCLAEKCSVAFVPCGHIVCCPGCAETLTSCPVCRAMIQIRLRTYVP